MSKIEAMLDAYQAVSDRRAFNDAFPKAAEEALPELRALLADYERMREWILKAGHAPHCALIVMAHINVQSECTCGLDALRATLKGEKHE